MTAMPSVSPPEPGEPVGAVTGRSSPRRSSIAFQTPIDPLVDPLGTAVRRFAEFSPDGPRFRAGVFLIHFGRNSLRCFSAFGRAPAAPGCRVRGIPGSPPPDATDSQAGGQPLTRGFPCDPSASAATPEVPLFGGRRNRGAPFFRGAELRGRRRSRTGEVAARTTGAWGAFRPGPRPGRDGGGRGRPYDDGRPGATLPRCDRRHATESGHDRTLGARSNTEPHFPLWCAPHCTAPAIVRQFISAPET